MGPAGTGCGLEDGRGEFSRGPRLMRLRRRLVLTVAVSLFLSALLTSCSGFFIQPTITSIYIQPSAATVAVGQSIPLVAYATYSDGTQNQISGNAVGWTRSA